jgi:hypothetical protein
VGGGFKLFMGMPLKKRRPLNEQTIVYYYGSAQTWYNHEYVTVPDIRDVCERGIDCENSDEHVTFDGQFFYRRKQTDDKRS